MSRGRKRSRIYWRNRGGVRRAYLDARSLGGGREALIAPGEKLATSDPDVAAKLAADRVIELEQTRRNRSLLGLERQESLGPFAQHHLEAKRREPDPVTEPVLASSEKHLRRALDFFGSDRLLDSIGADDVARFAAHLATIPSRRNKGKGLGPGTVRHHLNDLSNLFQRAQAERVVPRGYNPVRDMERKPKARREEAKWLEPHEAALLLESARTFEARHGNDHAAMYPLIATLLLTGGREKEVLGLLVTDVSFQRETVTFRPNDYRRLKTPGSHRSVPLQPQLRSILRDYLFSRNEPDDGLLFPSARTGGMIRDTRKALDAIAKRAGWAEGEIRTKCLRHTFASQRLQCLDRGQPISPFVVAREMGHTSLDLLSRTYAHLGTTRHRAADVEFRVEQHRDVLGERLRALSSRMA
ncbi:MAG: tyrosine-type recombinase/integrase [Gemmatimonadota bacterium]